MTKEYEKLEKMMTEMKKQLDTLKKENTTLKKESKTPSKKQTRKVSVPYQAKGKIITEMTIKTLAKYFPRDTLKTPKSTKKNPNPNPFPLKHDISARIFNDYEIAGIPWISYAEQLDIIQRLMKHYKYTKKSQITKYNDLLKYIDTRLKQYEDDMEKGTKKQKNYTRHKSYSMNILREQVDRQLEGLL